MASRRHQPDAPFSIATAVIRDLTSLGIPGKLFRCRIVEDARSESDLLSPDARRRAGRLRKAGGNVPASSVTARRRTSSSVATAARAGCRSSLAPEISRAPDSLNRNASADVGNAFATPMSSCTAASCTSATASSGFSLRPFRTASPMFVMWTNSLQDAYRRQPSEVTRRPHCNPGIMHGWRWCW